MKNVYTHKVAVCGYVYRKGKFLLLKRNTPPQIWVPPGGRLEIDEDPVKGLIREVKEETNLEIEVIAPANTWFGPWKPGSYLLSIDYLVRVHRGTLRLSPEHSDFAWASVDDLRNGYPDRLEDAGGFKVADFYRAERMIEALQLNL